MATIRAAFVMEQTLGHITHFQNLRDAAARQTRVTPTWLPIPFPATGIERFMPPYASNWSLRASVRARRSLSSSMRTHPYDAVFFHTQVTALLSRTLIRTVPSVVSLDATPVNYDSVGAAYGHRPATGGWIDERKFRLTRDVFMGARALVTWSEWARSSLATHYGVPTERASVIPPGAARAYFALGEQRLAAPRREGVFRLLFVGGDFVRKGGQILLESARAARTSRAFELDVVTREDVPAAPWIRVHRGVAPNSPQLLRLFRDADAFVLPSLGETLGLVLMEASAAALPIIATDVGAMPEVAIPGKSALVVPPGDARALREAIETIVDGAALCGQLGRTGYEIARARFDAERNGQRILDLVAAVAHPAATRSVA